jgi:hypothetical protein|tara:strand:+ start:3798 stop:4874 length:1077 start_codon:yes stop_codon:yes gene_type:complete
MVLKNYRTLAAVQDWDGTAQTIITQLPRDFLAQRYYVDMDSDDVKAAGAVTAVVDGGLKMITNIKIVAVGEGSSRTIFEVNGTDLYHMNLFDYGSPVSPIQLSLTTGQAQLHMNWCIDFRCNKLDPDDYSVALPTYLLSSLQLEITYAAPSATNYGSNPPTSFATNVTTRVTCVEGIPEAGEDFSSNPLMTVLSKTLTADSSTGSLESFDTFFQVGALIRRDFLRVETSSNVRADTEMTNYQVNSGTIPLMSNIYSDSQKMNNIINYRIGSGYPRGVQAFTSTTATSETVPFDNGEYVSDGYYMIDFYNNRMPFISTAGGLRIGGLSTVGYNTGDLVFQGNFANASSIIRRVQETVEG